MRPPIRASGHFEFIGKEVGRGSSLDLEYMPSENDKILRYSSPTKNESRESRLLRNNLKNASITRIANEAGLNRRTAARVKAGKSVRPKTREKIRRFLKNP